jgi:hypothetical protein
VSTVKNVSGWLLRADTSPFVNPARARRRNGALSSATRRARGDQADPRDEAASSSRNSVTDGDGGRSSASCGYMAAQRWTGQADEPAFANAFLDESRPTYGAVA